VDVLIKKKPNKKPTEITVKNLVSQWDSSDRS